MASDLDTGHAQTLLQGEIGALASSLEEDEDTFFFGRSTVVKRTNNLGFVQVALCWLLSFDGKHDAAVELALSIPNIEAAVEAASKTYDNG